MNEELRNLEEKAKKKEAENKKFFKRLKKRPPRDQDATMQRLHHEEFKNTDCLKCANCCKTTGPLFTDADIVRIAKHLKLKPQGFIEKFLRVDEDKDHVLQDLPCVFLGEDNYCSIYEVRPKACREFPHTDRKKFHQISDITMKNLSVCPAAYNIVEALKREYSQ
jgi:Fe-S-cluster containining protein